MGKERLDSTSSESSEADDSNGGNIHSDTYAEDVVNCLVACQPNLLPSSTYNIENGKANDEKSNHEAENVTSEMSTIQTAVESTASKTSAAVHAAMSVSSKISSTKNDTFTMSLTKPDASTSSVKNFPKDGEETDARRKSSNNKLDQVESAARPIESATHRSKQSDKVTTENKLPSVIKQTTTHVARKLQQNQNLDSRQGLEKENHQLVILHTNPIRIRARLPELQSKSDAQLIDELFIAISDKENYFVFHFNMLLLDAKHHRVLNPLVIQKNGMNLLHEIADKGRMSLLPALVQIGWFKLLLHLRVTETCSITEHRGKTAMEISKMKRSKKPLNDLQNIILWEDSLTILMKSLRVGDFTKAHFQIDDPDSMTEELYYVDSNGCNALYWTVVVGSVDWFNKLIDRGLSPGMRTKKNENLLHIAVNVGNDHMIPVLLTESFKLDPWWQDYTRKTPVDRVAENGDIRTMKVFIENGVKPKQEHVVLAAFCGRLDFLQYLLTEVKMAVDSVDMYSRTALHRACEAKRVDLAMYLIQRGANPKNQTCTGRNVLHIVAESGNLRLMKIFIKLFKEMKILHTMMNQQDRHAGVELCFLIRGMDRGRDAWHYTEVRRTLVPIFIQKTRLGAVDVRDYGKVLKSGWGVSPSQDDIEEMEDSFQQRRLNTLAPPDMTPLNVALFKGHVPIALELLKEGCDITIADCQGNTPLMIACSKGQEDIVQKLKTMGCDFKQRNLQGKTALDIAEENEHFNLVNSMRDQDAHIPVQALDDKIVKLRERLSQIQADGRNNTTDMKQCITETLREFSMDINRFLKDIGSGPVTQVSENDSILQN